MSPNQNQQQYNIQMDHHRLLSDFQLKEKTLKQVQVPLLQIRQQCPTRNLFQAPD